MRPDSPEVPVYLFSRLLSGGSVQPPPSFTVAEFMGTVMSRPLISWLVASIAAAGMVQSVYGQQPAASGAPRPAAAVVSVKRTDPTPVVYIEHAGPYWKVGPVFLRVREYMRTHNQPGPMFIRYLQTRQADRAGRSGVPGC